VGRDHSGHWASVTGAIWTCRTMEPGQDRPAALSTLLHSTCEQGDEHGPNHSGV